jgi:hypothetical protein
VLAERRERRSASYHAILQRVSDSAEAPTKTPTLIGPSRIERELARGGMGIVYLARESEARWS